MNDKEYWAKQADKMDGASKDHTEQGGDEFSPVDEDGCTPQGCLVIPIRMIILFLLIWSLIFGFTFDGTKYKVGVSCDGLVVGSSPAVSE